MGRFVNKTVVVTGGGGGIGGATCHRFATEGANVAVFDLNEEAAQKIASDIKATGGNARAYACNITDRKDVDKAVFQTETDLGPIDILVNNAGWDVFRPFTKTTPDQWERLIAINLVGDRLRDVRGLDPARAVLLVHTGSRGLGESILRAHAEWHGASPLRADTPDADAYLAAHDAAVG